MSEPTAALSFLASPSVAFQTQRPADDETLEDARNALTALQAIERANRRVLQSLPGRGIQRQLSEQKIEEERLVRQGLDFSPGPRCGGCIPSPDQSQRDGILVRTVASSSGQECSETQILEKLILSSFPKSPDVVPFKRTPEEDSHLESRVFGILARLRLMKENIYPGLQWAVLKLRERLGGESSEIAAIEGLRSSDIVKNPEYLRIALQLEADANIVEVALGGSFYNRDAPRPDNVLKFKSSLFEQDRSYTLEERARCARQWLQDQQGCITGFSLDESNRISCLPEEVCNLSGLRTCRLENQERLRFLPSSFGLLHDLQFLSITHCGLVSLPPSVKKLQGLSLLQLSHNQLTSFPDFGPLPLLKEAYISMNECRGPDFIGPLQVLRDPETGDPLGKYVRS